MVNKFRDRYTSKSKQVEIGEEGKIILTDDFYAICETLEKLNDSLRKLPF